MPAPSACAQPKQNAPTQEFWTGADVTPETWSIHAGITAAILGPLTADGWRVRVVGGYGEYRYPGLGTMIEGTVSFIDALVGYQHHRGPWVVKAFLGLASEGHGLSQFDSENGIVGTDFGVKAVIEGWLELGERTWTSLDLTWSSVHDGAYWARSRTGYRVLPYLSLGAEAVAMGNAEYDGGRIGLFARHTWSGGELAMSAGFAVDRSLESGAYATLNAMLRY